MPTTRAILAARGVKASTVSNLGAGGVPLVHRRGFHWGGRPRASLARQAGATAVPLIGEDRFDPLLDPEKSERCQRLREAALSDLERRSDLGCLVVQSFGVAGNR